MIFVTVGSMFPFDRLIRAMDAFAATRSSCKIAGDCAAGEHAAGERAEEIVAQIGAGGYQPAHMRWVRGYSRADYLRAVLGCDLVVAHAGMGSVITAGEYGKPIVLLPRRAAFGEHNNDHQADTAAWLGGRPGIHVAQGEDALGACIAAARAGIRAGDGKGGDGALRAIDRAAPPEFLARLRAFALGAAAPEFPAGPPVRAARADSR